MPPLMYRQTTNNSLELRGDLPKKLWCKSNTFLRQFSFYKSKIFFHLFSWFCLTDFWIFIPRKWIINTISNPCWASPWKFQFHPISEKSGFGQSAWWISNIVRQYTGRNCQTFLYEKNFIISNNFCLRKINTVKCEKRLKLTIAHLQLALNSWCKSN